MIIIIFISNTTNSINKNDCVGDTPLSGDVYTASEIKQIQSVSYGTLVSVREVQIHSDSDKNVIAAITGAVIGGFLGNTIGSGTGHSLAKAVTVIAGSVVVQNVQWFINKSIGVK